MFNRQTILSHITFLGFVSILLASQCAHAAWQTRKTLVRSTEAIRHLSLEGPLNITLLGKDPEVATRIILPHQTVPSKLNRQKKIEKNTPSVVRWHTKGGTLFINGQTRTKKPIVLWLQDLTKLSIQGPVILHTDHLLTHALVLDDQGTASVDLEGNLSIQSIQKTGTGHLRLQWVNSDTLSITSDRGTIECAGRAHHLIAKLTQRAQLIATALRSRVVWVQTEQTAHAQVLPLIMLNAFAYGKSRIDYFKTPQTLDAHRWQEAKILPLELSH